MMAVPTYEVGGRTYYQRPLTNYQQMLVEELLLATMQGTTIAVTDAMSFFRVLGKARGELMAYCLIPQDMTPKNFVEALQGPDFLQEQIAWFDYEANPSVRYEVVRDFFVSNQIGLCATVIADLMEWVGGRTAPAGDAPRPGNDLKNCAPLPPAATPVGDPTSTP